MKALYVGILTPGTTSRMRADTLCELLPGAEWTWLDTDQDFRSAARLLRSLAFRLKAGPVVTAINSRVAAAVTGRNFDLAWVDKGVYLWPETVALLRTQCAKLVHFTPDTAFHANRSRHFFRAAAQYDLLVTTKSFETKQYQALVEQDRVLLTTQAYEARLHRPPVAASTRQTAACFIGQWEPDRENCSVMHTKTSAIASTGQETTYFRRRDRNSIRRYECTRTRKRQNRLRSLKKPDMWETVGAARLTYVS